jgi:hypothetical protein
MDSLQEKFDSKDQIATEKMISMFETLGSHLETEHHKQTQMQSKIANLDVRIVITTAQVANLNMRILFHDDRVANLESKIALQDERIAELESDNLNITKNFVSQQKQILDQAENSRQLLQIINSIQENIALMSKRLDLLSAK